MKIESLLTIILSIVALNVQSQSYDLSVSTGIYADLTGATSLNNDLTWDDPEFAIPIGFDFQYFGLNKDQVYIAGFGFGSDLTFDTTSTGLGVVSLLLPYGVDLIDRGSDTINYEDEPGSLSPISYDLSGSIGNRILKIEWKNVGFYQDIANDNVSSDFTNFQLWLYESTNVIEIHFGPNSITQPELVFDDQDGAQIGLFPSYDIDSDSLLSEGVILSGDPNSPMAIPANTFLNTSLNAVIPNGTIYRFAPTTVGTSDLNQNHGFSIYPNPSDDIVSITIRDKDLNINSISILNSNGQKIKDINYFSNSIDVSDLNTGLYFMKINSNAGILSQIFLVN